MPIPESAFRNHPELRALIRDPEKSFFRNFDVEADPSKTSMASLLQSARAGTVAWASAAVRVRMRRPERRNIRP